MWKRVAYGQRRQSGRHVAERIDQSVKDKDDDSRLPAVEQRVLRRVVASIGGKNAVVASAVKLIADTAASLLPLVSTNGISRVELIALGVGALTNEASRTQMAFAIAIKQALVGLCGQNVALHASFFDPAATDVDRELVQQHGFLFETSNLLGAVVSRHGGDDESGATATIVFMPNCPRDLYHNVLCSAASSGYPSRMLLIGNELQAYLDTRVYASHSSRRPLRFNAIDVSLPFLESRWLFKTASGVAQRGVPEALSELSLQRIRPEEQAAMMNAWRLASEAHGAPRLAQGGEETRV